MGSKDRIGMRCYNPYVPNEIWAIYKKDLKALIKHVFPQRVFQISEFFNQGCAYVHEFIRVRAQDGLPVDWDTIKAIVSFLSLIFGMRIWIDYPSDMTIYVGDTTDWKFYSYELENVRTWTEEELDEFLSKHSFNHIIKLFEDSGINIASDNSISHNQE